MATGPTLPTMRTLLARLEKEPEAIP